MGFKKFDGSTWQPITPKKLKGIPYTGTLPATLTGTKAGYLHRYKIFGNTEQIGTPTPENPIVPSECGELENTGVHAGQYKLPLTSAGQDVDIYLGESQTTRRIKKLVLTGDENWVRSDSWKKTNTSVFYFSVLDIGGASLYEKYIFSTHFAPKSRTELYQNDIEGIGKTGNDAVTIRVDDTIATTVTDFKAWLRDNNVTVWYVLAEPETGIVNEPLMKIGNYADTIDSTQTSAQIPTSANSTTISWAGEGLAPSGFDSIQEWVDIPTYKRVNGAWLADN